MQFIKPSHIQRLLKLKTPEDVRDWREERKANFPTKAKREAQTELRRESSKSAGERSQVGQQFNGEQRNPKFNNSKFNKNGKFGRGNHRFQHGRHSGNQKRPFDQGRNRQRASSNEPNKKEAKLAGELSEQDVQTKQDNEQQRDKPDNVQTNEQNSATDPGSLERPANDGEANSSRDNRTYHTDNRFKRKRQPTLLEKVRMLASLDELT